ncbi:hypothetical protein JW948_04760 [bacterium]|nr:hypothetical protein [bacterium]
MNRTIRKIFVENHKVKLFSLFCAVILWFYVDLENEFEATFQIRINIVNVPEDKILIEPLPETVPVRYRGVGKALLFLKRKQHIDVDLSQYPDNSEVTLTLDMIKGFKAKGEFSPLHFEYQKPLSIVYDQYVKKTVPVVSQLQLRPKEGYTQVGEVVLVPDSVMIGGPAKEINSIDAVYTESRTLQVLRSIDGWIPLMDSTSALVSMSGHHVRFYADIQGIGERLFADIPVQVINSPPAEKVSAVPSTLSIRLQGGVEVLKNLKKEDIVATIDYRNRYRYGRRIPAMIHVPATLSFNEVKPRDFELLVER